MAYQKLQVSRALQLIKSDDANIPFPGVIETGTNSTIVENELEDTTSDFIALNVAVGDVVYNTTTFRAATVNQVIDNTRLLLNADIFLDLGDSYVIYSQNTKNEGCVLYIGFGGDLTVTTHAGDKVTFYGTLAGTFLPVQVLKVWETDTDADGIIALW
jgi:hypothetical protein